MNYCNWENKHLTECLDLATVATDTSERTALLKEAEKILLEEMPVIPIYSEKLIYMTNNRIKGIFLDNCGHVDFRKTYFTN